jgi:zinc finger CCHC domain-containing protein 9
VHSSQLISISVIPDRAPRSEARRQKRIAGRQAETTCFACREKGHMAIDCPVAGGNVDNKNRDESRRKIVGICYRYVCFSSFRSFIILRITLRCAYRCGSTRHTLARCKKPIDESNPLPFACCFISSGKGHLASSCPQNGNKGIYPNGGRCKLCGDTPAHLARNCGLRKDGERRSSTRK